MMTDLLDIDDGSALEAAKLGNLLPLINRLKKRQELNDDSLNWISARLLREKEGRKKTSIKPNKDKQLEDLEMYELYRWLTDIEKLKPKESRKWLAKIYSGKDDTIAKSLKKFEGKKSDKMLRAALGFGDDAAMFLATHDSHYRPLLLRNFRTTFFNKPSD